jgi:hypothetical protein
MRLKPLSSVSLGTEPGSYAVGSIVSWGLRFDEACMAEEPEENGKQKGSEER